MVSPRSDSGPFGFLWKALDRAASGMASEDAGKFSNWAGHKIRRYFLSEYEKIEEDLAHQTEATAKQISFLNKKVKELSKGEEPLLPPEELLVDTLTSLKAERKSLEIFKGVITQPLTQVLINKEAAALLEGIDDNLEKYDILSNITFLLTHTETEAEKKAIIKDLLSEDQIWRAGVLVHLCEKKLTQVVPHCSDRAGELISNVTNYTSKKKILEAYNQLEQQKRMDWRFEGIISSAPPRQRETVITALTTIDLDILSDLLDIDADKRGLVLELLEFCSQKEDKIYLLRAFRFIDESIMASFATMSFEEKKELIALLTSLPRPDMHTDPTAYIKPLLDTPREEREQLVAAVISYSKEGINPLKTLLALSLIPKEQRFLILAVLSRLTPDVREKTLERITFNLIDVSDRADRIRMGEVMIKIPLEQLPRIDKKYKSVDEKINFLLIAGLPNENELMSILQHLPRIDDKKVLLSTINQLPWHSSELFVGALSHLSFESKERVLPLLCPLLQDLVVDISTVDMLQNFLRSDSIERVLELTKPLMEQVNTAHAKSTILELGNAMLDSPDARELNLRIGRLLEEARTIESKECLLVHCLIYQRGGHEIRRYLDTFEALWREFEPVEFAASRDRVSWPDPLTFYCAMSFTELTATSRLLQGLSRDDRIDLMAEILRLPRDQTVDILRQTTGLPLNTMNMRERSRVLRLTRTELDVEVAEQRFLSAYYSLRGNISDDGYRMDISREDLRDRPVEVLRNLVDLFKSGTSKRLLIQFLDEPSIDAGGPGQEFTTLLTKGLKDKLDKADMQTYHDIGEFMMFCLNAEQQYLMGMMFDEGVFRVLRKMQPDYLERPMEELVKDEKSFQELSALCADLLSVNEKERAYMENLTLYAAPFTQETPEKVLREAFAAACLEYDSEFKGITKENLKQHLPQIQQGVREYVVDEFLMPKLKPIITLAKGMKEAPFQEVSWESVQKMKAQELAEKLQGKITKEDILASLSFDENISLEKQGWIRDWLEEANETKTFQFLFLLTGAYAVGDKPLRITTSKLNPFFHTCFNRLDLPVDTVDSKKGLFDLLDWSIKMNEIYTSE